MTGAVAELARNPRVRVRRPGPPDPEGRCVVYWMQRAQRALDNPALEVAISAGNLLGLPVVVFFAPIPFYPGANLRHYTFLAQGVPALAEALGERGVGFVFRPYPRHSLVAFCGEVKAALVVGDENPLREPERWRRVAAERLPVPLWTVDADVVVPSRLLEKEQYAARTIRPRLHRLLPLFLQRGGENRPRRPWKPPRGLWSLDPRNPWLEDFPVDRSTAPVPRLQGGTDRGLEALARFLREGLCGYSRHRNDPTRRGTSRLSPYLHFGHLGPLTVALAVKEAPAPQEDREAFLEELIVRRELAVNYVLFNPRYDSLEGCERWARETLDAHRGDRRSPCYTEEALEGGETHDPLWNAAQRQMAAGGWMHGYLRMYWAKKILQWSPSPEAAFEAALRLNDRYELDGRDPNGFAGVAWAVGGKHDRPWPPRKPVLGLLRPMSAGGCRRKFDVEAYIRGVESGELL